MLSDTARFASQLSCAGANLQGTRPYWFGCRTGLKAAINDMKCPHVFQTYSAADVQWPDLHKHMPRQASLDATECERARINSQNLNDNPGIAAFWFQNDEKYFSGQ